MLLLLVFFEFTYANKIFVHSQKIKLKKYGQVGTIMLYSKYRVTEGVTVTYL